MLQRKALVLVVPLWQQRDSHLSHEDVTMTSLARCTKPHSDSIQEAHVAAAAMRHLHHAPVYLFCCHQMQAAVRQLSSQ